MLLLATKGGMPSGLGPDLHVPEHTCHPPSRIRRVMVHRGALESLADDKALQRAMISLIADHTELFKQFSDNDSFRKNGWRTWCSA